MTFDPPTIRHEFYYEPKPEHPIWLNGNEVYTVVATGVRRNPDTNEITFIHLVEETQAREKRIKAKLARRRIR